MQFTFYYLITLLITFLISLSLTPIVKLIAIKIGAVDMPNERRINKVPMPSAGGLAIFISFTISCILILPKIVGIVIPDVTFLKYILPYILASALVVITGLVDDIKEISPRQKTAGIIVAGLIIWFFTKARFDSMTFPMIGLVNFEWWLSLPLTIIWILSLTNAVNLMDGLDGLVSGVSVISLTTIGIIGYFFLGEINVYVSIAIFTLIAAILGFLPYNFNPAKIYLGDTGALFLGFMISVISLQGLKNATFVAVLTPMLIFGVPITDTVFAIIRRKLNNQSITSPDRMHLHHRLISLGFSHRGAVLMIYAITLIFSFIALLINVSSKLGASMLLVASLIGVELFAEMVGIFGEKRTPMLKLMKLFGNPKYRHFMLIQHRVRRDKKKAEKNKDK
ncbi:MAG: undecaprenyl/decaprenyl-phosphate alpha-N-acetylglucosaminyl 1-phosphate transferase [Streptococcaceae bacterium]|jgi:UDP-GlcNAc:undecaprenyl-phosphate GlcNAc-1-phosphate transferase|nr:undecaprenyl/decaprenyl-phosphate alpha-N-acetylglucosaminyl 1-phosphate transferase [Streptococcaceae bacterium]